VKTANITYSVVLALGAIAGAQAQTPTPSSPDPAAASSPHQRDVTGKGADEAPTGVQSSPGAASSPHQRSAVASPPDAHSMQTNGGGSDPATFVKNAAQGGLTEVALSRAAQSKSQDPAIRKFAEHMVQDHSRANDELKSVAQKHGLEVPAALDPEHQAILQKLSHESGRGFDSAYSEQMVSDHKQTVALFEQAAQSSDPDVAAFARKTLPTLKQHEQMAEQLPGAMKSARAAGDNPTAR
jgi:putative membrane protein